MKKVPGQLKLKDLKYKKYLLLVYHKGVKNEKNWMF